MPRTADLSKLSREALEGAFLQLIKEGQLAPADVRKAAQKAEQIAELKAKIAALEGGDSGRRGPGRPAKDSGKKPRRKIKLSPEARRLRSRQGTYMGVLRGLSATDAKRIKAVRKAKGLEPAIALAEKLKGGAGDAAAKAKPAKATKPRKRAGKKNAAAKKATPKKATPKKALEKKAAAEAKPKAEGQAAEE